MFVVLLIQATSTRKALISIGRRRATCGGAGCRADSGWSSSRSRVRPERRTEWNRRGEKRRSRSTCREEYLIYDVIYITCMTYVIFTTLQFTFIIMTCMCVSTSSCALHVHCNGAWGAELQSKPFLWRSRATSCDGLSDSCLSTKKEPL